MSSSQSERCSSQLSAINQISFPIFVLWIVTPSFLVVIVVVVVVVGLVIVMPCCRSGVTAFKGVYRAT